MSVFGTKNIMSVFVGKDIAGNATSGMVDLLNDMADGQVVAVGTPATGGAEVIMPTSGNTAAAYPFFRLVEKQGGVLNYGPRIKTSDVIFAKTKTYAGPSEQTYYIGFNGTSGSLDVSAGNEFILTIAYDHDDMMWSEQKLRNSYDYYSAAPTQSGLAFSMVSQINYKENLGSINGTGKMVVAEVVTGGAFTASSGGAFTVVNGSTTVTTVESAGGAADAGKYNSDASTFAVGDLIRLGGTGGTVGVYTISAITGAGTAACTITLNMPYQGTSGSVSAANAGFVAAGSGFGIKVQGQTLTWVKDFFKFLKVKFHFDLKGFGTTVYDKIGVLGANSAESSKGTGTSYEVAELESFAAGFEGALNRMKVPLPAGRTYADTATPKTYDVIVIESVDSSPSQSNGVIGNAGMRVQQFVCMPVSAANKTKLANQLNTLLGVTL